MGISSKLMSYFLVGVRAGFVPLMLRDLIIDDIVDKSLAPGKDGG